VQFPIADNPKAFKGAKRRITDIPSGAQVEIEGLQPYNRRQDDPTRDPLWILNELSNIDKHRLPHLTLFALGAMHLGGNARFKIRQPWERAAVEDRAKLLGFSARRAEPSRKVDVEFKLELSIAFEEPIA